MDFRTVVLRGLAVLGIYFFGRVLDEVDAELKQRAKKQRRPSRQKNQSTELRLITQRQD